MTKLSIGDRVSDLKGTHDGRLIDIDGATGYVEQANGVEVEFPIKPEQAIRAPKNSLRTHPV